MALLPLPRFPKRGLSPEEMLELSRQTTEAFAVRLAEDAYADPGKHGWAMWLWAAERLGKHVDLVAYDLLRGDPEGGDG